MSILKKLKRNQKRIRVNENNFNKHFTSFLDTMSTEEREKLMIKIMNQDAEEVENEKE